RRAADHPAGALRGGGRGRRRRLPDRPRDQAAGAAARARPLPAVLGDRQLPAVQRAEAAPADRPGRHRQRIHGESVRVLARLHRTAGQLRGRGLVPPRAGHRDRLRCVPVRREPQEERMTAINTWPGKQRRRNRLSRRSTPLTIAMLAALAYFLVPLLWLVVSSTKSTSDLINTFGLWFARAPQLFGNIHDTLTQ